MRNSREYVLFGIVLFFAVGGQILARAGAQQAGVFNLLLLAAYGFYLTRGALWVLLLRKAPLGRVYPLLSLNYPLVLLCAVLLFNETLTPGKIAGTICIAAGGICIMGVKG